MRPRGRRQTRCPPQTVRRPRLPSRRLGSWGHPGSSGLSSSAPHGDDVSRSSHDGRSDEADPAATTQYEILRTWVICSIHVRSRPGSASDGLGRVLPALGDRSVDSIIPADVAGWSSRWPTRARRGRRSGRVSQRSRWCSTSRHPAKPGSDRCRCGFLARSQTRSSRRAPTM